MFLLSRLAEEGGEFLSAGEAAGGVADLGVSVGGDGMWVVCADVEEDSWEGVWGIPAVVEGGRE